MDDKNEVEQGHDRVYVKKVKPKDNIKEDSKIDFLEKNSKAKIERPIKEVRLISYYAVTGKL